MTIINCTNLSGFYPASAQKTLRIKFVWNENLSLDNTNTDQSDFGITPL